MGSKHEIAREAFQHLKMRNRVHRGVVYCISTFATFHFRPSVSTSEGLLVVYALKEVVYVFFLHQLCAFVQL